MEASRSCCAPIDLPCGATAPASPHSVVVSLPTLQDVIGYETGCPRVKRCMTGGYPRFVEATPLCRLQTELLRRLRALPAWPCPPGAPAAVALVSSAGYAAGMLAWVGSAAPLASASAVVPGEQLLRELGSGGAAGGGGSGSEVAASGSDAWAALVRRCGGHFWSADASAHSGGRCSSSSSGSASISSSSSSSSSSDGGSSGPGAAAPQGWALVVCLPSEATSAAEGSGSGSGGDAASPHRAAACTYQQHTGCRLGSRDAETLGARLGLWEASACARAGEEGCPDAARAAVEGMVQAAFPGARAPQLAANGMAAFTAAYAAVQSLQARAAVAAAAAAAGAGEGGGAPLPLPLRDQWLMLGSLYLDTACLLQRFPARPGASPPPLLLPCASDAPGLEALLAAHGARLAGVVTECPTNPLLQSCDLPAVRAALTRHAPGALLIVDPTLAGLGNLDPTPHCDIVVCSLTKYAGASGDVMGGAVGVSATSPHAGALAACGLGSASAALEASAAAAALCSPFLPAGGSSSSSSALQPPSPRDLLRLASSAAQYVPRGVAQCSATAEAVHGALAPLCGQPGSGLRAVHWGGAGEGGQRLRALARAGAGAGAAPAAALAGCMLTLELEGTFPERSSGQWSHARAEATLARFYDALRCVKGPSFGTVFTLACPFMYLAHYDMVSSEEGRFELARRGLNPYLVRLCVGEEPADVVVQVVQDALAAARAASA